MDQWKILVGKIILELIRGTGRREDSHRLSCPQRRAGACGLRIRRIRCSFGVFSGYLLWAITASSDLVQTLVPEEVLQEYIYQQMSGTKGQ